MKRIKLCITIALVMVLGWEIYSIHDLLTKKGTQRGELVSYQQYNNTNPMFFPLDKERLWDFKQVTFQPQYTLGKDNYHEWKDIRLSAIRFDDKSYSIRYKKEGDRKHRYGVTSQTVRFDKKYIHWKGKAKLSKKELTDLTKKVFKLLPHIRTTPSTVALVVETAITESNGGYYIASKWGDCGVFQIKVRTYKDLMAWLEYTNKDIFHAILGLYNEELSARDNLISNIPLGIAVCITEYWRKGGASFLQYVEHELDRGVMWKSLYNTHSGMGTVQAYLNRVAQYDS